MNNDYIKEVNTDSKKAGKKGRPVGSGMDIYKSMNIPFSKEMYDAVMKIHEDANSAGGSRLSIRQIIFSLVSDGVKSYEKKEGVTYDRVELSKKSF